MRCAACSTENPPLARFCLECGAPQPRRCAGCGTTLPDAAKFCLECGQPVGAAAGVTASQPAPTSATSVPETPTTAPPAQTPHHLAARMLADGEVLQGERKQVTILFADVVGSTAM